MKYILALLLCLVSIVIFSQNLDDYKQIDKFKIGDLTVKVYFNDPLKELIQIHPNFDSKADKEKHSILSGFLHNNPLYVFQTIKKRKVFKTYTLRGNPKKIKEANFYNIDIRDNLNSLENSIDKVNVRGTFFEDMLLFESKDGKKMVGKFTKIWGYFTRIVPYDLVKQGVVQIIEMDIENRLPADIIETEQEFIKPLFEYQKIGLKKIQKRILTTYVCRYDSLGELISKRPRIEEDTSLYLSSISKDLGSVTSFPYFAESDSIIQDGNITYVKSGLENINHYLKDIAVHYNPVTGQIEKIESFLIIHSYSKEGHSSYDQKYIAEFADVKGCSLPKTIKYCSLKDEHCLTPGIIKEIEYLLIDIDKED